MQNRRRNIRCLLYILTLTTMIVIQGCNNNDDILPPQSTDTGSADGAGCPVIPKITLNESFAIGHGSIVYGTIEKVEPVTDRYRNKYESGTYTDHCDGDIQPGIRIYLRVKKASWNVDKGDMIKIGFLPMMSAGDDTLPRIMHRPTGKLRWSDGGSYFPVGAEVGTFVTLTKKGGFILSYPDRFFLVDSDGKIYHGHTFSCLEDGKNSINGRMLDDVIRRARKGTHGKITTPESPFEIPLYSICIP